MNHIPLIGTSSGEPADITHRMKYTLLLHDAVQAIKNKKMNDSSYKSDNFIEIIESHTDIVIGLKGKVLESLSAYHADNDYSFRINIEVLMALDRIGIDLSKENQHILLKLVMEARPISDGLNYSLRDFNEVESAFLRKIVPDLNSATDHHGIRVNDVYTLNIGKDAISMHSESRKTLLSLVDLDVKTINNNLSPARVLMRFNHPEMKELGMIAVRDKNNKLAIEALEQEVTPQPRRRATI